MVSVAQEDRDALRFFWVDDITASLPDLSPCDLLGVFSSPFLLNATIRRHVEGYRAGNPLFVDKFIHSIYVDDLTSGSDTEEGAIDLYTKSTGDGHVTNDDESYTKNTLGEHEHLDSSETVKWVLRYYSRTFGWRTTEEVEGITVGSSTVTTTVPLYVPRCYFHGLDKPTSCNLVGFCDSSESSQRAYAAVVYLKMRLADKYCDFALEVVPDECLLELKAESRPRGIHNLLTNAAYRLDVAIRCEDFSTLKRLLKVTALVSSKHQSPLWNHTWSIPMVKMLTLIVPEEQQPRLLDLGYRNY
eukprot:Em0002g1685a